MSATPIAFGSGRRFRDVDAGGMLPTDELFVFEYRVVDLLIRSFQTSEVDAGASLVEAIGAARCVQTTDGRVDKRARAKHSDATPLRLDNKAVRTPR